jgi:membrane glycosyltransferase
MNYGLSLLFSGIAASALYKSLEGKSRAQCVVIGLFIPYFTWLSLKFLTEDKKGQKITNFVDKHIPQWIGRE